MVNLLALLRTRLRRTRSAADAPAGAALGPRKWLVLSQLASAIIANFAVPAAVSEGRFFFYEPVAATLLGLASLILSGVAIAVASRCRSWPTLFIVGPSVQIILILAFTAAIRVALVAAAATTIGNVIFLWLSVNGARRWHPVLILPLAAFILVLVRGPRLDPAFEPGGEPAYTARLMKRFPPSSSETDLIVKLQENGFEPTWGAPWNGQPGEIGATRAENLIGVCAWQSHIYWRVKNGTIVSIRGLTTEHGCL